MEIRLTQPETEALAQHAAHERRAVTWRRYRAIQLLAQGQTPQQVAAALGCCLASVYNWATAWQREGRTDLGDPPRAGRPPRLEADGEQQLEALLASDPQAHGLLATGWTVPLLQTQLAQARVVVSEHTLRRVLHRLGWRWKRPRYQLGRPDPDDAQKKGQWWHR
ncbi:MAG TPA: helix-turn-helix domain-containing protein [Ktedonobacterales bacterium]